MCRGRRGWSLDEVGVSGTTSVGAGKLRLGHSSIDPYGGTATPDALHRPVDVAESLQAVVGGFSVPAPGRSLLPDVARQLGSAILLIDPTQGAFGLARQFETIVETYSVDTVVAVYVGGDILAHGRERGLRSPLADGLVLAGMRDLRVRRMVAVLGLGLDVELSLEDLRVLLGCVPRTRTIEVVPADTEAVVPILEWHPAEASELVAMAVHGVLGLARMREAGQRVKLTDDATIVSRSVLHADPGTEPGLRCTGGQQLPPSPRLMQLFGTAASRRNFAWATRPMRCVPIRDRSMQDRRWRHSPSTHETSPWRGCVASLTPCGPRPGSRRRAHTGDPTERGRRDAGVCVPGGFLTDPLGSYAHEDGTGTSH